jgi:hypothetical protein
LFYSKIYRRKKVLVLLLTVFKARVSLMTEENRLPRGSLKSREYIPVWVGERERKTDKKMARQTG